VQAADRSLFRLDLARRMGASAVVDVDAVQDEAGWFLEHHEGLGFDVVFEMSGSGRAVADAFRIARNGGKVVLFGLPERPVEIDVAEGLIFKNLEVRALSGRRIFETWYRTRWLLESGVVDLRPLITHELPLERFEEAFAALEAGEACKIVLHPNGPPERTAAAAHEAVA
jgi:threonine 3-dehydrogenase